MDFPLSDVVDFATLFDPVEHQLAARESGRVPTGITDFAALEGRPRTSATPPRRVQAEMWSHTPTMRERIAQFVMGDSRSSTRRDLVTKLLGTSGLGETRFNLVDFTPAGSLFGVQEAYRAGDPQGMALAVLPGAPATRPVARSIKNVASKSALIYDPPPKPPRAFEEDYRAGARYDDTGRLTHTIDGDEIAARYVVGRRVVGGGDEALPAAELDAITKATTGRSAEVVAPSRFRTRGAVGVLGVDPLGRPKYIYLSNKLKPDDVPMVHRHELGHVVDELAGQISTKGLSDELTRIYNDLNVRDWRFAEQERTGVPVPRKYRARPEDFGYTGEDVTREYIAEAIRAYMTDPNYLKSVAPRTAAAIRAAVNSNPKLREIIQFNSIAAVAALPVVGARTDDEGESWEPDRL